MSREGEVVTKGPIKIDPPPVHRDDPRKSGEIEMRKIDGANASPSAREGFGGEGPYADPRASRPGKPNIVQPEYLPRPKNIPATKTIILEGGPADGEWQEIPTGAMSVPVLVEIDPTTIEPFVFDAEEHERWVKTQGREGRPNIVRGTHETVLYRFSGQNTEQGHQIFSYAEAAVSVPA